MACLKRFNIWLTLIFAAIFFVPSFFGREVLAKNNKYVSSRESLVEKRAGQVTKSTIRLSVKGAGSAKLKKSSFWNKKPFQFSTPVVSDTMLYVGSDSGIFYGLDTTKNIKKRWQYKAEGAVESQASAEESFVYFGDAKGYAYALSASDGKEVWKSFIEYPVIAAPLISGDRLYFLTEAGVLVALGKSGGQEIFRTPPLEKSAGFSVRRASAPVFSGGLVLFGTSTGMLLAVRENGSLAWVKQLGNRQELVYDLDSRPLISGGRIYVTTADRNVFCLDSGGSNILWTTADAGGPNDLAMYEGKLYATGGGVLTSMNPEDGSINWEQDFETPEISSPAVSQNVAAVISTQEKFYLVDTATGDILYERYIKSGSFADPVFAGDRLYMISNSGAVVSYLVREKPAKSPKKT